MVTDESIYPTNERRFIVEDDAGEDTVLGRFPDYTPNPDLTYTVP